MLLIIVGIIFTLAGFSFIISIASAIGLLPFIGFAVFIYLIKKIWKG